jgi:hypothetical protein
LRTVNRDLLVAKFAFTFSLYHYTLGNILLLLVESTLVGLCTLIQVDP